jgi:hypothetical protein
LVFEKSPGMKLLFSLLIVLAGFPVLAQTTEELLPELLVLDTTMDLAPSFNAKVMQYAPGYRLQGSEKQAGQRIIYTCGDGREGTIRLEYKYENESGKQVVIYQAITADLDVVVGIFNALFRMNVSADIDHASMIGGAIQYHHREYQCLMQADEYTPGYWVLSFVK